MTPLDLAILAQKLSDREKNINTLNKSIGASMASLAFQCIAEFYIEAHKESTVATPEDGK
jgi:hypothetical protein